MTNKQPPGCVLVVQSVSSLQRRKLNRKVWHANLVCCNCHPSCCIWYTFDSVPYHKGPSQVCGFVYPSAVSSFSSRCASDVQTADSIHVVMCIRSKLCLVWVLGLLIRAQRCPTVRKHMSWLLTDAAMITLPEAVIYTTVRE